MVDRADIGALQLGLGAFMLHDGSEHGHTFWLVLGAVWSLLGIVNMIAGWLGD